VNKSKAVNPFLAHSGLAHSGLKAALLGVGALAILPLQSAGATDVDQDAAESLFNLGSRDYHGDDASEAVAGSVVPDVDMATQNLACADRTSADPRIMVRVQGIQSDEGNIRVQIYGDNPDDFLQSGKKVTRVDVPSSEGELEVCLELPAQGTYAMAVLHDRNANGRVDILSEGFGFSNNPSLGFSPPDHDETAFVVDAGVGELQVALTYIIDVEEKDRRRRRRR